MVVMSGGKGLLEPVGKVPGAAEHATMDRITSTTQTVWAQMSAVLRLKNTYLVQVNNVSSF